MWQLFELFVSFQNSLYKWRKEDYNLVMKTTSKDIKNDKKGHYMNSYVISCCTTVDLKKEYLESRNIEYIYFHYFVNGVQYDDDLGQTMSNKEFYDAMRSGAETKTSQINAAEYEEFFESFLSQGKDVLHINISSGISGAYNSANIAKSILEEKYPERKIYVVDSLNAASGYGLLVDKAVDLKKEGKNIDEVYHWIEENKLHLHAWFFTDDLTYLVKGGRVSKAAGLMGGVLNICPLFHVDREGKLVAKQKVRTKKKAIRTLVEQMETYAENGTAYTGKCFLCHADNEKDAAAVVALIEERIPAMKDKVLVNNVGTTIGSHTGPGVVAIFFWGEER